MTAFESLLYATTDVFVLDSSVPISDYAALDLSADRIENAHLSSTDTFEKFLETYATCFDATFLFGGYNEKRNIYQRSSIFNDNQSEERNIHIGLDIWADAQTPIFAALDGKVHSFALNTGIGNYGPTIILEHKLHDFAFHTLYGHLSLESIENLKIGDTFTQGMQLGVLGDKHINGDYAPHLHFQIIIDMEGNSGDYPGVCIQNKLDYYLKNCPDPNLLLKLRKL